MQHVHQDDSTGMSQDLLDIMLLSTAFHKLKAHTDTHTCTCAQTQTHLQSLRPSTEDVPDLAWAVVQMVPEAVCLMIAMLTLMQHLTLPAGFCQH